MPITIRHIKRLDAGYTGASRTLLGRQFEPMGTTPYNDGLGWQGGAYTTRVYEEGDATLLFPNAGGSDAVRTPRDGPSSGHVLVFPRRAEPNDALSLTARRDGSIDGARTLHDESSRERRTRQRTSLW